MREGRSQHFDADQPVLQPTGNVLGCPIRSRIGCLDEVIRAENLDAQRLPPGEEHHCLHAQELADGPPLRKLILEAVIEQNHAVEGPGLAEVRDDRHVEIHVRQPKVGLETTQNARHEREKHLDDDVLEAPELARGQKVPVAAVASPTALAQLRRQQSFPALITFTIALSRRLRHLPLTSASTDQVQRPSMLGMVRCFPKKNAIQLFFPSQKLDQIVQEAVDHVRLVHVAHGLEVQVQLVEPQAQPALHGVDRDHPEDAHDVLLHTWQIPVREMTHDAMHGYRKG
mmetsp:Transcript_13879/g.51819  ORF Transcript_13879/g.51819 Transcript_13879/m.51819 type:complete len:285 (+) Transcript_13879:3-857(+)